MKLVELEFERNPDASRASIRHNVKKALIQQNSSNPINLSESMTSHTLKRLRERTRPIVNEAGQLLFLGADTSFKYCRDVSHVGADLCVTLGDDRLLALAAKSLFFAGDATFKTVSRENRTLQNGKWFLYNIVVKLDQGKFVVVYRALITSLTSEVYRHVWARFFFDMISVKRQQLGLLADDVSVSIAVPYLSVPPHLERNAVISKL